MVFRLVPSVKTWQSDLGATNYAGLQPVRRVKQHVGARPVPTALRPSRPCDLSDLATRESWDAKWEGGGGCRQGRDTGNINPAPSSTKSFHSSASNQQHLHCSTQPLYNSSTTALHSTVRLYSLRLDSTVLFELTSIPYHQNGLRTYGSLGYGARHGEQGPQQHQRPPQGRHLCHF